MIVSLCLATLGLFPIRAEIIEGKTATEITNRMTAGWNLGNTLDANSNVGLSSETSWGNPKTTQAMIDAVKAAGFNTIRIPVSWGKQTKNDGTYTYAIDSQWLARVKEVVEYCFNDGLFVILNIHHDNSKSYYYPSSSYKTQSITYVKDIWTQLANEFAYYDQHLIFESLNEPRLVGTSDEWWFNVSNPSSAVKDAIDVINQLNQTAIDAIRGVNKGYNADRVVMCPGYCASLDGCITSNFKLPNDNIADRIAVSVHAYTPYTFCMDTNPGTSVFSDNLKNDVKYLFEKLRSNFTQKGIPVIIGETSASNKDNLSERMKWVDCFFGYSKNFDIPCILWDNNIHPNKNDGESHGYLNRQALVWYDNEIIDEIMKVMDIHVGLDDALADDVYLSIYPNPASEQLFIESGIELDRAEIFDIYGRLRKSISIQDKVAACDVNYLTSGTYIVRILTKQGTFVKQFVVR